MRWPKPKRRWKPVLRKSAWKKSSPTCDKKILAFTVTFPVTIKPNQTTKQKRERTKYEPSKQQKTRRQGRRRHRSIQGHRCCHRQASGRGRRVRGRQLCFQQSRRGQGRQRNHRARRQGRGRAGRRGKES